MPISERRSALQPYLDQGLTRSEAYQRYLATPVAIQPTEAQRNQQTRNVETRVVTPLQRTLRRAFAGSPVPPTTKPAPKPKAKPVARRAAVVTPAHLKDAKPSQLLSAVIRARQLRKPRP